MLPSPPPPVPAAAPVPPPSSSPPHPTANAAMTKASTTTTTRFHLVRPPLDRKNEPFTFIPPRERRDGNSQWPTPYDEGRKAANKRPCALRNASRLGRGS